MRASFNMKKKVEFRLVLSMFPIYSGSRIRHGCLYRLVFLKLLRITDLRCKSKSVSRCGIHNRSDGFCHERELTSRICICSRNGSLDSRSAVVGNVRWARYQTVLVRRWSGETGRPSTDVRRQELCNAAVAGRPVSGYAEYINQRGGRNGNRLRKDSGSPPN
jgi:hypothetical protein